MTPIIVALSWVSDVSVSSILFAATTWYMFDVWPGTCRKLLRWLAAVPATTRLAGVGDLLRIGNNRYHFRLVLGKCTYISI
jgi:hypothetical protein